MTIVERGDFIPISPQAEAAEQSGKSSPGKPPVGVQTPIGSDPAIVTELIKSNEASVEELKRNIKTKSGPALFEFILEDIQELKRVLFNPQSTAVFMAAMDASAWINEKMNEWLGEINAADTLSQSVQNNITSEMGLELMDVADVIRPYPQVIDYLQSEQEEDFLEGLITYEGGQKTHDALTDYLSKYGMRCTGEIDITRTRWSETGDTDPHDS